MNRTIFYTYILGKILNVYHSKRNFRLCFNYYVFKCLRFHITPFSGDFEPFPFLGFRQESLVQKRSCFQCSHFIRFNFLRSNIFFALFFGTKWVVVVIIKSLHFEQHFQMSPFSIVLNGTQGENGDIPLRFHLKTEHRIQTLNVTQSNPLSNNV